MTGWQDIATEVLARIRTRAWPPGSALPHEAVLAAEFGVARATVNRALQALAAEGWLERRRRAGTRVALEPVRRATLRIPVIRAEIEATGRRHDHRLLDRGDKPAPPEVARALALAEGTHLLHLPAVHLADGRPYAAEDRWVNLAAVPALATADLGAGGANAWLVRHAPFTHGDYAVAAEIADAGTAATLGATAGAAVLTVTRTTWNGAVPITWVRLRFAPGHQIRAEL